MEKHSSRRYMLSPTHGAKWPRTTYVNCTFITSIPATCLILACCSAQTCPPSTFLAQSTRFLDNTSDIIFDHHRFHRKTNFISTSNNIHHTARYHLKKATSPFSPVTLLDSQKSYMNPSGMTYWHIPSEQAHFGFVIFG